MTLRKLLAQGLPEPPATAPGPADIVKEGAGTLRKLFTQGLPEPPATAPGPADILTEIYHLPLLAPIRHFWNTLNDMRPWWPILFPLLILFGWRSYRRERTRVLARRRKASS